MPNGNDYAKGLNVLHLSELQNCEFVTSIGTADDVDQLKNDAEQLKREVEVLWQCIKVLAKGREA